MVRRRERHVHHGAEVNIQNDRKTIFSNNILSHIIYQLKHTLTIEHPVFDFKRRVAGRPNFRLIRCLSSLLNTSLRSALTVLLLTPLATLLAADAPAPPTTMPNIVLILADELGYGDVGCYGATKVKTPHIDRLASEGRRFTDAHSASAVCTPSRYALLTGE